MEPAEPVPVREHAVDGVIFRLQRRRILALVPLAPVILHGQHILHHGVVQRAVVRFAVSLDIAVDMISFLVETVAGQIGQFLLLVEILPLAAIFFGVHQAGQGLLPEAQQFLGHAHEIMRRLAERGGQDAVPVHGAPVAHRSPADQPGTGLANPAERVVKAPFQAVIFLPAPEIGQGVVQGAARRALPETVKIPAAVQAYRREILVHEDVLLFRPRRVSGRRRPARQAGLRSVWCSRQRLMAKRAQSR